MDTEEELLEIGKEYDEILPLLLDYLYMKYNFPPPVTVENTEDDVSVVIIIISP